MDFLIFVKKNVTNLPIVNTKDKIVQAAISFLRILAGIAGGNI